MLTDAQLKERATYIGSSDAKIIAGGDIAEWMTLMRQKSGEERAKFSKQTQLLMDTGSLEPYIIDKWAEAEKRQVNFRGGGKTIIRNGVPLHSTFDGRVVGDNAPLEIKAHFGFKDMDELAEFYAPQCQHHMLVSGADRCYLVALFGVRCRMEWRMLTLDQSWASMYLDNCVNFWNMYQNGTEAEPMLMPHRITLTCTSSLTCVTWMTGVTRKSLATTCWHSTSHLPRLLSLSLTKPRMLSNTNCLRVVGVWTTSVRAT